MRLSYVLNCFCIQVTILTNRLVHSLSDIYHETNIYFTACLIHDKWIQIDIQSFPTIIKFIENNTFKSTKVVLRENTTESIWHILLSLQSSIQLFQNSIVSLLKTHIQSHTITFNSSKSFIFEKWQITITQQAPH